MSRDRWVTLYDLRRYRRALRIVRALRRLRRLERLSIMRLQAAWRIAAPWATAERIERRRGQRDELYIRLTEALLDTVDGGGQ